MQTVSRLITQFIPEHYQLSLDLDRPGRQFTGAVTIQGVVPDTSNSVSVHAKDLTISSATVDGKATPFTTGRDDELTIVDVAPGRHDVTFVFSGVISDAMHGLYPCYYTHEGVKKELLATQFESHHAREVFPCIDEPEAKATFDVTLITESEITVLGNMPILSQQSTGDRLETTFGTTPRMSTYLLAWVAGDLHRKTATTKSGVEVNVWATPAQPAESLDFALDVATRTIDFFDDYFGTPYPLPKSDHIALPDFSSGAMENWGLVTYREIALLADPKTTSVSSKHYVATVIAHELSHQWFGNLVTMKWWNDLWLNESFATLMEYIAVDALHPDWNIWMDFSTHESIIALRRDALEGVQAVQVDVNHPDQISTLFDPAIVYAKGARLLRMLQQYIGHADFQAGLKQYFAMHKYGNTQATDLWKALADASGKDIAGFMTTWISQPGYPKVTLQHTGNEVSVSQKQFFIGPHQPSAKTWPIPLNPSVESAPLLLDTQDTSFSLAADLPLLLNRGDSAHFITQYDDATLAKHIENVRNGTMDSLARLQLLHEQSLLARSGDISSSALIPLLSAYTDETAEAVWDIIGLASGELRKFIEDDKEAEEKLRHFSADLARKQYERLGWEARPDEAETDTKLRATIIGMMIYGKDKDALNTATKLFRSTPVEDLDPELRAIIIGAAVRYGDDPAIIDSLIETYKTSSSSELQQDIASGITSSRDPGVITRTLAMITDDKTVRHQDVFRWFIWTIRNRYGRDQSWQWMQDKWDWIDKTFGSDKSYDDYPKYSANSLMTRRHLQEYRDFFGPKQSIPALSRVISMGMSELEGRVELIERDKDAVCKALREL